MNRAKLYLMLALLKAYRAQFCFADDRYEKRASAMIHDVRFALEHGGFYRIEKMQIGGA